MKSSVVAEAPRPAFDPHRTVANVFHSLFIHCLYRHMIYSHRNILLTLLRRPSPSTNLTIFLFSLGLLIFHISIG